jgi:drug/metabolite transporter (DMT)-like permease
MFWLTITILGYFLLALVAIIDKILLAGPIPKPKVYAFYVGVLGILALVLIPFGFDIPDLIGIGLAFLSGGLWVFALIALYSALRRYEASRVIPAIGGMLPLLTLSFSYLFSWQAGREIEGFNSLKILSFLLLILGSVLINWEKGKAITKKSLQLSILAALLFSLSFTTAKLVYLEQSFVSGFIWMRIGGFLIALLFIFSKDVREELFNKLKTENRKPLFKKPKIAVLFLFNQGMGATAGVLQNLAIYSAPMAYLAFINALEGTRYVFLLILTIILSLKFPRILSEKISKPILLQKTFAIILIAAGLVILALS